MRVFNTIRDAVEYAARSVYSSLLSKPYNFSWFREGSIAASGLPATRSSVEWLVRQGIKSVLSLTESVPGPLLGSGLRLYHVPMENRMPAPVGKLVEAARVVKTEASSGNPVLVHCLSGRGRTGMVLASYLVLVEGLDPEDAIALVRRTRPGSLRREDQANSVRSLRGLTL